MSTQQYEVVRPDGYVGLRFPTDAGFMTDYLRDKGGEPPQ